MTRETKILLDIPEEENVSLEFDRYSDAFVSIIRGTKPHFTLGIFGDWGTGKTTLMKKIEAKLKYDKNILPIWFNAWRYEKEPDLLIPLLGTMNQKINDKERTKNLGNAISNVIIALASGIKLCLPPVEYDYSRFIEKLESLQENRIPDSRYFRAFSIMDDSFKNFIRKNKNFRFVIFIDDLDRCMPQKALEILESIKLFFDFDGFIFIIGLNSEIVEKLVDKKLEEYQIKDKEKIMRGEDYIKKIINISFTLPPVKEEVIIENYILNLFERLPSLRKYRKYASIIAEGAGTNPREIKRFINDFIIIYEIGKKELNPETLFILRVLYYRWRKFYNVLSREGKNLIQEIEKFVREGKEVNALKNQLKYPILSTNVDLISVEISNFLDRNMSLLLQCKNLDNYFYYSQTIAHEKITKKTLEQIDISKEEFLSLVKKKKEEFGGLLTNEGAMLVVTSELGLLKEDASKFIKKMTGN